MNSLACKCVRELDGASAAESGRLFAKPSNTAPLLSLLQESGEGKRVRDRKVSGNPQSQGGVEFQSGKVQYENWAD